MLAVSLLFSPFPPGVAYWTDSDLDGVKEWIEGLAAEDSWWVSQQLRRLDVKTAIKKVPKELKHFLEEADATNS